MRFHVLPAAVSVALLLTGCGGGPGQLAVGNGAGGTVVCGDAEYDPADLADAPMASSLPEGPAGAVDDAGEPAFDPSAGWRVVHGSDDRFELVRELDEPMDGGQGDVRTHEVRVVERISGATNVVDGTWMLTMAGPCTQRVVTGSDLGEVDLTLSREHSPDDTVIDLWVHERACASGRSAEGRVELIEIAETDGEVRLRIGVRSLEGAQDCQGNPPTAFAVELERPLGDREILDAAVVPVRPLTVGSGPDQ